mgnify:FL=1|tara:strand:- start:990 stop:1328 length:339 start_codon:yes stop_codon:yes gene_type:complete
MTTKFDISNYTQLNSEINALFRTGLYSHVAISIFTDEAKTTPYVCPMGMTIASKKIKKVEKVAQYTDPNTGVVNKQKICVVFDDDKCCECIDSETVDLWYSLEGVAIVRRRF